MVPELFATLVILFTVNQCLLVLQQVTMSFKGPVLRDLRHFAVIRVYHTAIKAKLKMSKA